MARIAWDNDHPSANDVLMAFQEHLVDTDNRLERAEIRRVSDTMYIGRLYYLGDPEFDSQLEDWSP